MNRVQSISVTTVVLLLLAGCSAAVQHDDARMEGVRIAESDSSEELSLAIEQPDAPLVMGGQRRVPVRFELTLGNRRATPVTVERITLQSAGGASLNIPSSIRKFNRTIEPGAAATLDFWADVVVAGTGSGTVRAPIALRAAVAFTADGARREAVFMRQVNGSVMLGVTP